MNENERTELHRRIRWRITVAEESLDQAITALTRANELAAVDGGMREEFQSDITLLRGKLDRVAELLA
jgi:hypothetical protein